MSREVLQRVAVTHIMTRPTVPREAHGRSRFPDISGAKSADLLDIVNGGDSMRKSPRDPCDGNGTIFGTEIARAAQHRTGRSFDSPLARDSRFSVMHGVFNNFYQMF